MNNDIKDSKNKKSEKEHKSFKPPLEKAIQTINIILAPLLIFSYLRDVDDNISFIVENPMISAIFIIFFATLFIANISHHFKSSKINIKRIRLPKINLEIKEFNLNKIKTFFKFKIFRKKFFVTLTIFTSVVALILVSITFVTVYITGVHYAQIASFKTEKAAVDELLSINKLLAQKGEKDLRARAYAVKNGYIVTVGQFHFTRASAQAVLDKVKLLLPRRIRNDTKIYTPPNISLIRRLKLLINKILK
jgi:hypothetical protein